MSQRTQSVMVPGSDRLSLVIPVYRNEGSIGDLLEAVAELHRKLEGALQAIFVVDGSPDQSWQLLHAALPGQPYPSRLVLLSRNFGSFAAIRAGLAEGDGSRFAVMAADLQEPPHLVLDMDKALRVGDVDVVIGIREARSDPWTTRIASGLFWRMYRRFVVRDMPPGGIDIFACNREFRDSLLQLEESHTSLIAQIFWLGFRRTSVPYQRQTRRHGKSAWTFTKKVNYLMDSVFAFTDLPVRVLTRAGMAGMLLAVMFGSAVAAARLAGLIVVPGYAPTIIVVLFFGALNVFSLGIVGSYAWRAYENTKARPLALTQRVDAFGGRSAT